MGRATAIIFLLISLAGVGWAAVRLVDILGVDGPAEHIADLPVLGSDGGAVLLAKTVETVGQSDQPFLPVFGLAPQVIVAPAPAAIAVVQPGFDYRLKGVIASDSIRWAVFADLDGDVLVREGDAIGADGQVVKIHAEGVDILRDGQTIHMTFSDSYPVAVEAFVPPTAPFAAAADPLPRPAPQQVIYQGMTRAEILAVLQQAQDRRRERGWLPATE